MILFADGRRFQIAGTVLSDGVTIIPFSAISLGLRPDAFPIAIEGVSAPVVYVVLDIVGDESILAAMSTADYNRLALSEVARNAPAPQVHRQGLLQRTAQAVARRCGSCGNK